MMADSLIVGGIVVGDAGVASDGDLTLRKAGRGLRMVTTGTGPRLGTALLAGGTVIVATTAITVNSLLYLCHKGDGGAVGFLSETKAARVAGTSFVILSSNGADAGNVDWLLLEPA